MISYFTNKNNNIQQKLQPGDIFINTIYKQHNAFAFPKASYSIAHPSKST